MEVSLGRTAHKDDDGSTPVSVRMMGGRWCTRRVRETQVAPNLDGKLRGRGAYNWITKITSEIK